MKYGVNYTPRRGWFHSWLDLDLDEVREDFAQIRSLGLDHVRIFPLWPLLQPNRTLIRSRAIDDVVAVARVAGEQGLRVSVDVLNGHLSSYDFVPSWLTSWHATDMFTDPRAIEGQRMLVHELALALRDEPHVSGLTLGNEFTQFARADHPHASTASRGHTEAWLRTMFAELHTTWPRGQHHHSFDDSLWFDDGLPFTPRQATIWGQATTVHSWTFVQAAPLLGANHPHLGWFARYLCEVAAAWSPAPERRIWLQEVGAPRPWTSDEAAAGFLRETIAAVAGMPQVTAITWWCSHDVSRDLADFPELEYSLGLFTQDGEPKPEALALAEVIDAAPRAHIDERPAMVVHADRKTGVGRSVTAPGGALFRRWCELAEDGTFPAMVMADQAENANLLDRRGISELLD
ncbi:glycoside hydrolase 5 family protein [Propionibacteriaceae bacterium G1746]|uniref:glycoside hydrolase 5 family protein n=1 Tax=Aestuariimicrobium sp. G57 TaxID=3418485 RepID=UPI003C18FFFA